MPVPLPGFIAGPDVSPQDRKRTTQKVMDWPRDRKARTFAQGHLRVGEALKKFPRKMWSYRPSKDRWCIGQILWHLADQEANLYVRLRRAACEPGHTVAPYDQDKWAVGSDYLKSDPEEAWQLLKLLRTANVHLLERLPASAWQRYVQHSELGKMTIDHLVGLNVWHLEHHLGQMTKRYLEWKAR